MAKSKRRKRSTKNRTAFYEAVPMVMTPPAVLPDVSETIEESRAAASRFWSRMFQKWRERHAPHAQQILAGRKRQSFAAIKTIAKHGWRALHTGSAQIKAAGLATSQQALQLTDTARITTVYALDGATKYLPPIAADMGQYLRRCWRAVAGRRARTLYLAVALTGVLVAVTTATAIATATLNSYAKDISSPAALMAKKKTGTTILDRNGQVLFAGYGAQDIKTVRLSDLPQSMKDATLAAEDPNFYDHPGFSWKGTLRAAFVDITHGGRVEGGSTLTQQLVKNALLTSDKKFERKYQEILLAMQLEQRYSKDQILEMYLNEIYYGQGSTGIEAASETYFHKPAKDLTLGESALLAGLPLGPSRFDPNADLQAATGRRDYVLGRMTELGKITKAQAAAAKAQPLQLAGAEAAPANATAKPMIVYTKTVNIQAPHFVFYVLDQLRAKYGDAMVEQGGITVTTTLDLKKQQLAEQTVRKQINALSSHHVTNGGLISLEPGTGDILAMVGSVDYNAPGFGAVNVTLAQLQPGSSFKPIAYATAFKKGWNGATKIDDTPMSVPNGDGTMYTPQNYDLKFHGSVTLRHALDNSLNIPAVKVLQFAGIPDTLKTAHDMGITSLNDPSRYGLSLVLGGGEVRPIDMATVYGTFANSGIKVEPQAIKQVTDRYGKDITKKNSFTPQNALDPRIAYMITNILSDDSSRQPEFPANGPLHLSRPAAAKTGTTNDFRDNWTVGYTPQLVTAVWVGNNDHTPMSNVDGITGAAPIWHDYMEGALAGSPVLSFKVPSGVTIAKVCADGGLANPWDSGHDEVFMSDAVPTSQCHSYPTPSQNDFQPWSQPTPPMPAPVQADNSPGNDNSNGPRNNPPGRRWYF